MYEENKRGYFVRGRQFGDKIEVLDPMDIREKLKDEILGLNKLYNELRIS